MKLLITGGAGFIGSHLCEKYTKEGHVVICLDNFMNGDLLNVRHLLDYRNFRLVKGDVRDFNLVEKVMSDVDVVFHLAAQVHVDRSYIEPQLTYDVNVTGTQNILEAARMSDTKKVIYASTSEVYGSAQYVPIDERHPLNAPHPYGASKIAADRMCYAYAQTYGMNIFIPRFFNIFGPRQRDLGYGGVISIFTRRVLSDMPPLIYGDGRQSRDYTYIRDVVNIYDSILIQDKRFPEPINFGTGRDVSIADLANKIIDLCGKRDRIKPVHVEPRIGEVQRLVAKGDEAKKLLGWQPSYDLDKGLADFIDWYKKYGFEERLKID
ncbi:MAG: GDP-mannose 4,6-dehydratase [Candidatus Tectomicrobia bacterium]|uniref:GDP-mannose 4,6-dehydratase n=1 Tax=Tectimicrobiota bacterium TaxID=2528274 RepID=A0A933LQ15_UNCTE|nr:GDP-mannose 4,6-dehydratase [Candidatus Tectomicrobia bacterium]